jgi:two-component system, chemotaxis family, protein-glutamate methylesterase/glutaminase
VPRREAVAIGASAGGVEALRQLVSALPPDFSAAVLVVLHLPTSAFSALPSILDRAGPLPAMSAEDYMALKPGTVVVAPPDRHLTVRDGHAVLGRGPKENGHRPAIDPLFRSLARWFGPQAIGVVLSGTLDDGASGLATIKERGGAAVVQDPATAMYGGMPSAALQAVPDALVAPARDIARAVVELCREEVEVDVPPAGRELTMETEIAVLGEAALADPVRPGRHTAMTCPDCNGAMFELEDRNLIRYRCRVGHAWSPQSLLLQQVEAAETAIWAAIRTLEEKAALHRNLATRLTQVAVGRQYHQEQAEDAQASAAVLRDLLRRPLMGPPSALGEQERETG